MNKFSMPADFKTDTIVGYAALNRKYEGHGRIIETYGQITSGEIIASIISNKNDVIVIEQSI